MRRFKTGFTSASLMIFVVLAANAQAVTLSAVQDADVATGGDTHIWDNDTLGDQPYISVNFSGADSVIGHIQFDVSGFSPGTVASATLRLFQDLNSTKGVSYDIQRVDSSWDEATVTYPTRPTLDGTTHATLAIGDNLTEVWREWDVTSLVQEWVDGVSQNYGMALLRNPDASPWPYFRSKDYTDSTEGLPELVVETVPEPTGLTLVSLILLGGGTLRFRTGVESASCFKFRRH